jgi:hypothetical protein
MMAQFARQGVPAMGAGLTLSRALLANQGMDGAFGFARGLRRPGRRARAKVDDLLAALSGGDELSTRRILGHGAGSTPISGCWTSGCAVRTPARSWRPATPSRCR